MRKLLRISIILLLSAAAVASAYLVQESSIGQRLELTTYDVRFRLRGPLPAPQKSPITILAIVVQALDTVKQPLIFWPKEIGKVITRLAQAGASVVAVDLVFGDLHDLGKAENQQQLAAAILQAGGANVPVIMGYRVEGRSVEQLPLDISTAATVNADLAMAPGNGKAYVNLTTDLDDFVRRQELFSEAEDGSLADSFAYAIAKAHLRTDEVPFVPLPDQDRTIMINFRGLDQFPQLSLAEVWKDDVSPEVLNQFKGRIVLLGMVNEQDRHATPLYSWVNREVTRQMSRTPGVYIHASTLATLLEQDFIVRLQPSTQLGILIALVLLVGLVCSYFTPLKAIIISLVSILLFCLASYLTFSSGIWINTVAPILGSFLTLAGVQAVNYALEGKDKRALRSLFQRYVHDQVIEQILENPDFSLAGERKRITVLFADIRNFTTRSEGARAEDLVNQLNRYLERMVTAIQNHQGTVDKFLGDGIMAIFGAPLADPDSALHAVRAGQAMLYSLDRLNEIFAGEGIAPMRMGIGLHTGEAIVGNIGSSQKTEYTAIGDVVNTASRVEGLNKQYQTCFLITRDTYDALEGRFEARYIADAHVKGRMEAVPILELDWQKQENPPGTVKSPISPSEDQRAPSLSLDPSIASEKA